MCTCSFIQQMFTEISYTPDTVLGAENRLSGTPLIEHEFLGLQDVCTECSTVSCNEKATDNLLESTYTLHMGSILPSYKLQLILPLSDSPGTSCITDFSQHFGNICISIYFPISFLCVWRGCSSVSLGMGRIPSIGRYLINVCWMDSLIWSIPLS